MEELDNNNDNNSNIIKKFLLEITGKFKPSSTVEFSNYEEALESFNQHSKSGKNLILYELHKSSLDGSVIKKVPVLNTSKHAERMRILEEEARVNSTPNNGSDSQTGQQPSSSSSSKQKNKMTLANMKFKIIILASVVGGLILVLFLLDFLASGGGSGGSMAGHIIGYDAIQNFVQTSLDEDRIDHHVLVSLFFLL